MSLKYRDSTGTETPVAGLNGTNGELVPSVALVQKGSITITQSGTEAGSMGTVTFQSPMPDTDYIINIEQDTTTGGLIDKIISDKTVNGFKLRIYWESQVAGHQTKLNWSAFKLMTDTVHEADSAHIAQNTANFAPAFSDSVSYAVGDYVTYNDILYRCTTAHTAGVWVAGHFTQVTVGGTLSDIVPSDASASNKLVTQSETELVTIPLSKFQVSSGGAVGYADLGATNSQISQAFSWLEVEYGRVDGFPDKYFISIAGSSSNLNYIRVVRLAGIGQTPAITLDADKHIWMSMDTYVYIRVRAYGNFILSGTLSRTAPTGTAVPIDSIVKQSDLTSPVHGSVAPTGATEVTVDVSSFCTDALSRYWEAENKNTSAFSGACLYAYPASNTTVTMVMSRAASAAAFELYGIKRQ